MENNNNKTEIKVAFANATLTDYSAILANSIAYGSSVHRIKLAKLQEMSGRTPQYQNPQQENEL